MNQMPQSNAKPIIKTEDIPAWFMQLKSHGTTGQTCKNLGLPIKDIYLQKLSKDSTRRMHVASN